MKKILFLALCLLFIIGLSSCGKDKSNEQKAVNEAKSLTVAVGFQDLLDQLLGTQKP